MAKGGIDIAQAHDGDHAGENEQAAGHDAARGPVQQPADIGRKLLRLRTREQHAVVQRMQKTAFGDPVLFLDQDAVHYGDLPGRTAEAQHGNPQPDPKGLPEADAVTELLVGDFLACWDIRHFKLVFLTSEMTYAPGPGSFLLARFHAGPLRIAPPLATVRLLRICQVVLAA